VPKIVRCSFFTWTFRHLDGLLMLMLMLMYDAGLITQL